MCWLRSELKLWIEAEYNDLFRWFCGCKVDSKVQSAFPENYRQLTNGGNSLNNGGIRYMTGEKNCVFRSFYFREPFALRQIGNLHSSPTSRFMRSGLARRDTSIVLPSSRTT